MVQQQGQCREHGGARAVPPSPGPQPGLVATDIAVELRRLARAFEPLAAVRGVVVEVEHPDRPTPVAVVPDLVRAAFGRLAANALEAMTPAPEDEEAPGGLLSLRALEPEPGSSFVAVELADTGRGIPAEALPRLFDPAPGPRGPGGSGPSLAETCQLIESQGGFLAVESEPGLGSCFTVYLRRTDDGDCKAVAGRMPALAFGQAARREPTPNRS